MVAVVETREQLEEKMRLNNASIIQPSDERFESALWWARQAARKLGYKAEYDALPDVWLVPVPEGTKEGGAIYAPQFNAIIVSSNVCLEETLVHELTHWIQEHETGLDRDLFIGDGKCSTDDYVNAWFEVEARLTAAMWKIGCLDKDNEEVVLEYNRSTAEIRRAYEKSLEQHALS